MANPNPLAARLAQRRRRKAGTLRDLTKSVWQGVRDAERALEEAVTVAERCSAVHALASIAGAYAKLLQVGELEARFTHLEMQMEALRLSHE